MDLESVLETELQRMEQDETYMPATGYINEVFSMLDQRAQRLTRRQTRLRRPRRLRYSRRWLNAERLIMKRTRRYAQCMGGR